MSFRCGIHGWAHAQSPCPNCAAERPPITFQGGIRGAQYIRLAAVTEERDEAQSAYRVLGRTEEMLRKDLIAERDALRAENAWLRAVADAAREVLRISDRKHCAWDVLREALDALAEGEKT